MTTMNLSKTLDIAGHRVTVRELTVGEVRAWLKRLAEASDADPLDQLLLEGASLADLAAMTDLAPERMEAFTPSQLRQVLDACREVNRDFFALRERVETLGRQVLERLSSDLNETPAP